jgi:hypothetical protein
MGHLWQRGGNRVSLGPCHAVGWSGIEQPDSYGGDGAEWIPLQSCEVFRRASPFCGRLLSGHFHVSEYLAAAAPVCRPNQPDHWRHTQQKRLKRGAVPEVIAVLTEHLEPQDTQDQEAPVRQGHRYRSNRFGFLDYPGALALGLPIGSGMIESGHRYALHARLKKAGTAWLRTSTPTRSPTCAFSESITNGAQSGISQTQLLIAPKSNSVREI